MDDMCMIAATTKRKIPKRSLHGIHRTRSTNTNTYKARAPIHKHTNTVNGHNATKEC